ncbi:sensor histidine kinase [Geovibrio ferrireducens]|uniref:sensor histidine kinase n=1 Tax=Geovibrio ferrireducens TaxID=46201 RepID=UPI0022478E25|nr:HAMP domain-containing sensor histidine kinase [Geovibrio ferrireducens]
MNFISESLRLRIVLVFVAFSILLGGALAAGILISTKYAEKYILKKRLNLETDRYIESVVNSPFSPVIFSPEILLPESPYMTSYLDENLLPDWAAKDLTEIPEGNYEKHNDKQNYYVAVRDLGNGQRLYILFNVTTLLTDHIAINVSRTYFTVILVPIFIVGLLLGVMTSYKAVSPVVRLTKIIKRRDSTGKLPKNLAAYFRNDEVGFLAKALEHSINEMQSALDREKAFARDASHELRSPVTVVQGAIRILAEEPECGSEKTQNVISRIKRASLNMEHLINSFLWLSRQERHESGSSCRAASVIRESVENNSYLLRNKPVEVKVCEYADVVLPVASEFFYIVVSNIIRNAITYTKKGEIVVSIYETYISARDTGPGIPQHVRDSLNDAEGVAMADGFGFGLSIAHRMCTQLGWKLELKSGGGKGSDVIIHFGSSASICGLPKMPLEG